MQNSEGAVALMGLGASTAAAAAYLLDRDPAPSVTLYAGPASQKARDLAAPLEARGARTVWDTEELEGSYDLGVMSPGIPATSAFYANARAACRELVSEPELAWRASPRDWVAVTGTNGKTTTTRLATALLEGAGVRARAVGNIGLPPVQALAGRADGEVFVAELSSFQLHGTSRLAPRVAVLLNVTPDHVEWHGTLGAYAADKERVFANLTPRDLAVLGTDETCRAVAARLRARGLRVAVLGEKPAPDAPDAAWVDGRGRLAVRLGGADHVLCAVGDMRLRGAHNVQNALAAAAAALEMGADERAVADGLAAFEPLAHRIEPCGTVAGVRFVDDSKATNTDAAVQAVGAFEQGRVVVLLGGHDKGTDLADLARTVAGRCKAAVAFGAAGPRFAEALARAGCGAPGAACSVDLAPTMRAGFERACELAGEGDVVLLSPACSSFDEFSGYKQRGEAFQGWVAERASGGAR